MQTQRVLDEFRNEPFTDFSKPENAKAMKAAIEQVRSELGREYPCLIDGEKITLETKFQSYNPANKDEVIGVFSETDEDLSLVEKAIDAATEAFKTWRFVPAAERAEYLFKISDIMRKRKHELSALMVLEVAKTWAEADGDTAEAIDFMEFYGREMLRWSQEQPITKIPGEDNSLEYIPLGVGAIIPPWNFPLAIMSGMTMAAVVAGNTVVLKPSSDSPTIAAKFIEIVEEAGLPKGVVNFLTGGPPTGEAMVTSPKTRFISFTGSKGVGLHINEEAAKTRPGQIWIKRVVAEMGGKDAIIVTDDADLESAAVGIVQAAYGFQGQKCSACSRLIVDEKVHDELLEKVIKLTEDLKVGQPTEGDTNVAAVINQRAFDKTLDYIKKGVAEGGEIVTGGTGDDSQGYFILPTIIDNVKPGDTIEQEEIFAPVLAVIKARDYDHALEIANGTEFGLTGSVYSASQERLDRARREFHVGNLYLNRKCTGALVGVHPFGGFNMSGTDSKAGGREYLLQFMQGKTISQKI
ncbi:L-glutamate gamma-semialdehyde dehydrogenase [Leptolyngbya sp. 7M]|uniref:L-glutamate gamma-semialdehyde dehydrogenase n=1 Tax=Leptolyngbya sp. 7M TaxID=2812896 RepID=UPI001B8CFF87|nr:L-glutamate gamma-semialdehyde dehydrogenase [Leptolyngbya sp. 7M]QYO66426.1 L-glutamate gamma-semialdehyde dehydrogenase [Leptolyngbya sp. 7M]